MTKPGGTAQPFRVVIVGGGVIGLCCAYHLARGGAEVLVLERDRVGSGASEGNAGTISAGHPPLNRPGRIQAAIRQMLDPSSPLFVPPRWDPPLWRWLAGFARYCTDAHVAHCMSVMAPLGMDALALFDQLMTEERIQCDYRAAGYYEVCSSEDGLALARHEASVIEQYGYHPEYLTTEELLRREPALSPELRGGVYFPEAAVLNPARFLTGLRASAEAAGVEVREGAAVRSVDVHSGSVRGVELEDGTSVGGDAVVLATGPFSLRMARAAGVRLPVQPGKGYHRDVAIGPNGAPALKIACVLNETSVFCTPMDTFVRFAGTMEFSGANTVLRPARLRQLTDAAREAFPPMGTARPLSQWCGLRPMSVDGLPIVGPLGDVEGLSVATGHGMLGLTLGPVTGEMISRLVLDGGDPRIEALSPRRFG